MGYRHHRTEGWGILPFAVVGLSVLVAGVLPAGCQSPMAVDRVSAEPPVSLTGTPFDPAVQPKYILYPSDKLLVRYPSDKELDQEVRIRSDGMISLPYVGDIQAAYRAPEELAGEINERTQSVLANPRVAVIVLEEVGRVSFVSGQVRAPGMVPLRPSQTLAQAIVEAGGVTTMANTEQVLVVRAVPNDARYVLTADLKRILAGKDPDIRLQPYDVIHVPETIIAQVDLFVEQYVNALIPRPVSFPFMTQLHNEPLKIINSGERSSNSAARTVLP